MLGEWARGFQFKSQPDLAAIVNVYGEDVGYVHVDLLELLAGDAVPPRNKTPKSRYKLTYRHVSWVKEAADRNAFAKEVNTADVAPELY